MVSAAPRPPVVLVATVRIEELARETAAAGKPRDGGADDPVLQNGVHAWHLLGVACVDLLHHRVGVRARQHGGVQHVWQHDVGWIHRRSADAVVGVDAHVRFAYNRCLSPRIGRGRRRLCFRQRPIPIVGVVGFHGLPPLPLQVGRFCHRREECAARRSGRCCRTCLPNLVERSEGFERISPSAAITCPGVQ